MIEKGQYGIVAMIEQREIVGVGLYIRDAGEDIDYCEESAVVIIGSPFNNDYIYFEHSDLRPATLKEKLDYLEMYTSEIKQHTDILNLLGVK